MTGWITELVEKLFKECIFVGERPELVTSTSGLAPFAGAPFDHPTQARKISTFTSGKSLDSPIFLHLVHPYALARLKTCVEHVKRFHDHVSKLPAKGEESHIAKDVLLDITEGIGVDLQYVGGLLAEIVQETKGSDGEAPRLQTIGPFSDSNLQLRTSDGASRLAAPFPRSSPRSAKRWTRSCVRKQLTARDCSSSPPSSPTV